MFVPLLVVAVYAQWKKVSKGQRINAVMAFTTVFFGLTIPTVSKFRNSPMQCMQDPQSFRRRTQHWILGMRRAIVAALYLPSDMTIDECFAPPYSADEIARWGLFQAQLVIGDFVMVRPCIFASHPPDFSHHSFEDLPDVPYLRQAPSSLCCSFRNNFCIDR